MIFYERLAQCCAKTGFTVTSFTVDVLGLSKSTPTNWKKGINLPNADAVIKAAKYFGVSSDYLLSLSDSATSIDTLSGDEKEFLMLLRSADSKDAELALNSARAILATREVQKRATSSGSADDDVDTSNVAF